MSMLSELKRRNVLRVAIGYLAAAWLLIQVAETVFPVFSISTEFVRLIIIFLGIGFPFALLAAWIYELTTCWRHCTMTLVGPSMQKNWVSLRKSWLQCNSR